MSQSPDTREWLALARSECTSPEILREVANAIAGRPNPWTRGTGAALTRNPNTPLDVLLCLAEHYPAAFCQNPIVPLLPLEYPDCTARLTSHVRRRLLCQPNLPPPWVVLLQADADREVRDAATQHVVMAEEIAVDEWESELRTYLRGIAQVPPGEGRAAQRELVTFGFAPAWSVDFGPTDREADDLIPSEIPAERHGDIRALLGLDGYARLPLRASRELQQAFHSKTRRSFLNRLAESEDLLVCLAVASHPAVGTEILADLLHRFAPTGMRGKKQVFDLLRAAVLLNPSTPGYIRDEFARDANPALRRALRHRPNAPYDWTEVAREQTRREVQIWSLPEERRPLRRRTYIPRIVREWALCSCPFPRDWTTTEAPPTPFCTIVALANSPLNVEEWQQRIRAATRSESHFVRLGATLSSALTGEPKLLELLGNDVCRLVRAVARARRNTVDWHFTL